MRIVVVGATGGSGRAVVDTLVDRGHSVTAFVRRAPSTPPFPSSVHVVGGDATEAADVDLAVRGQEAVVVTLGIRENPVRVRVFGSAGTPLNVRSAGTRCVIEAMRRAGVRKLVVQTSYGVGDSRARLSLKWRALFALLLKPQIADTERQEEVVRASDLDWVVVQPVALTDTAVSCIPFASVTGDVRSMAISRRQVATFLADATETRAYDRHVVALS